MHVQRLLIKAKQEIPHISSRELFKIINDAKERIIVLDVREKNEVSRFRIPASYYIPRSYLEIQIENIIRDKNAKIVVYCANGARSLYVAKFLKDIGYTNVYNLSSGINGWIAEGLPTEKDEEVQKDNQADSSFFYKRYERHFKIPEIGEGGQRKLFNSKVLVIGAGGLGCPALLYLAASGVGTIGIVDFDIVDESNLQRQVLHLSSFIGRPKTESAYFALKSFNPYVNIKTYQQRLSKENIMNIFKGYDIVIDGSDNFTTRYLVNDACIFLQKPYIHGSIFRFEGQLTSFYPTKTACYRCMYSQPPSMDLSPSCEEAGVLGVLPGVIGTLEAVEAIKIVLGIGEPLYNKLLCYNALTNSFRMFNINKNASCAVCGDNPTIKELAEYQELCS